MSPSKTVKCSTCQVQNLDSVSACDYFGSVETLGLFNISDLLFISQKETSISDKLGLAAREAINKYCSKEGCFHHRAVIIIGLLSSDIQDCLKLTPAATKSSSSEFAN